MASVMMSISVFAQHPDFVKEIGLSFSSLDNFGVSFKFGKETSPWKIGAFTLSDTWAKEKSINPDGLKLMSMNQNSNGFSVQLGKEFRNEIIDNVYFTFGPDYNFINYNMKYNYQMNEISVDVLNYDLKYNIHELGFNLGFTYVYNDKIVLQAFMIPGIYYLKASGKFEEGNNIIETINQKGIEYNLNNNIQFTIAYRL
jgi:hypothetical protein